ncbi:unnamed protein product, partial [Hymenolepis diminuta]
FSHSGFKKDDFSLKDEPRAACSNKLNSEQLQANGENITCTTRELSETFHVGRHMTIYREMKTWLAKSQRLRNGSRTICRKSTSNNV